MLLGGECRQEHFRGDNLLVTFYLERFWILLKHFLVIICK